MQLYVFIVFNFVHHLRIKLKGSNAMMDAAHSQNEFKFGVLLDYYAKIGEESIKIAMEQTDRYVCVN